MIETVGRTRNRKQNCIRSQGIANSEHEKSSLITAKIKDQFCNEKLHYNTLAKVA